MGKDEPGLAASPRCGRLGCSPGQGTEQTLCAPVCRPGKENIPGIHPAPWEAPRGSGKLPPQQGWGWSMSTGGAWIWVLGMGRGQTRPGRVRARWSAGAAVRASNYGFGLPREERGCSRCALPVQTAKLHQGRHCPALPCHRQDGHTSGPGSPPAPFSTHRTAALRLSPAPAPGELNPPRGSRDRKSSLETCHFLPKEPQGQAGPRRGGRGSLLHNGPLIRQRVPEPPMAAPGCCHGHGDEGCNQPGIPAGMGGQRFPPPCHHGGTQRGWCSPRRHRTSHRLDVVSPLC